MITLKQLGAVAGKVAKPEAPKKAPIKPPLGDGIQPEWEPIRAGCQVLRAIVDNPRGVSEPLWYASAGVIFKVRNGRAIFHQISAGYDGYTYAEADAKFDQAGRASPPRLCQSIEDNGGNCEGCPLRGKGKSPISLGYVSASAAEAADAANRWIHVRIGNQFLDLWALPAVEVISPQALDIHLAGKVEGRASMAIVAAGAESVHDLTYRPGKGRFEVPDRINIWQSSCLTPVSGDCLHIEHLIEHLFPVEDQREYILNVLAQLAQDPATKIRVVLLIRGLQRSGKTTLFIDILSRIVGETNLKAVAGDALASRFNNELGNCQVLVLEEIALGSDWEASNKAKELITAEVVSAEGKYKSRRPMTTPRLIVGLSNKETPVPLEESDGRFFVPDYGPGPLAPEFYMALHKHLESEVPAFLAWLLARDLSGFNPNQAPPMTPDKAAMIGAVKPLVQRQIETWIEGEAAPFDRDLVTVDRVANQLRYGGPGPNPLRRGCFPTARDEDVIKALRALGAQKVGQLLKRPAWEGRPQAWAWRNLDQWRGASAAALSDHLSNPRVFP